MVLIKEKQNAYIFTSNIEIWVCHVKSNAVRNAVLFPLFCAICPLPPPFNISKKKNLQRERRKNSALHPCQIDPLSYQVLTWAIYFWVRN
jgi:hypothetical protein